MFKVQFPTRPARLLLATVALVVWGSLLAGLGSCRQESGAEDTPPQPARSGPAISIEPGDIDLGKMRQSEERTVEAVIRNVGTEELIIENVGTSCGCTVASLGVKSLAPGAETTLEINFNSKKFSGKLSKRVTVTSNDPEHHQLDFHLHVEVITPVMIQPNKRSIANRQIPYGTSWSDKVVFTTRDVDELEVTIESYGQDVYEAVIENGADGDPRKSVLTVTTHKMLTVGTHNEPVKVKTNVPEAEEITISVHARVIGDLRIEPRILNFGLVNPDQEIENEIIVRTVNSEAPFHITAAEIDLPGLQARVESVREGEEYRIVVTGRSLARDDSRATTSRGRIRGFLRIRTDRAEEPELTVRSQYLMRL